MSVGFPKSRNRVAIAIEYNNRWRRYRRGGGVLANNCAGLIALKNASGRGEEDKLRRNSSQPRLECVDIVPGRSTQLPATSPCTCTVLRQHRWSREPGNGFGPQLVRKTNDGEIFIFAKVVQTLRVSVRIPPDRSNY